MVTDLVGNHIGLRELAGLAPDVARTKAPLEVLKETCVEIDLLIDRAAKRSHNIVERPANLDAGFRQETERTPGRSTSASVRQVPPDATRLTRKQGAHSIFWKTRGRRPPPFPRDSRISWHTVNLCSAASSAIIRTSEHFHVFSPPPRLSVRMFGSWGKKRANPSSNCAAL